MRNRIVSNTTINQFTFGILIGLFSSWLWIACDEEKSAVIPNDDLSLREITLITSLSGLGDCGYNDLFMAGACQFAESHEVEMHMYSPATIEECQEFLLHWIENNEPANDRILVVSGDEYESLMPELPTLAENERIIMLESNSGSPQPSITHAYLSRYGVSYLAASMLSEFETQIIAAYPNDQMLEDAIAGFVAGYKAHGRRSVDYSYLASDISGFAMIDSAYRWVSPYVSSDVALYPLLGGSELGLIHGINDDLFATCLLIGMDVDQRSTCSRIPFSVVFHIDQLLNDLLCQWYDALERGESPALGKEIKYGLESKYVDIVVNTDFRKRLILFDERDVDEMVFINSRSTYYQEAIDVERELRGL